MSYQVHRTPAGTATLVTITCRSEGQPDVITRWWQRKDSTDMTYLATWDPDQEFWVPLDDFDAVTMSKGTLDLLLRPDRFERV